MNMNQINVSFYPNRFPFPCTFLTLKREKKRNVNYISLHHLDFGCKQYVNAQNLQWLRG